MHHHHGSTWPDILNTLANLAIVAGYVSIPFTVLRKLPLTPFVRVAGVFFFLGCSITHVHMAAEVGAPWWLTVNHIIQAVAVWCFVIGFARLVTGANRRRAARGGDQSGGGR